MVLSFSQFWWCKCFHIILAGSVIFNVNFKDGWLVASFSSTACSSSRATLLPVSLSVFRCTISMVKRGLKVKSVGLSKVRRIA